VVDQKKIDPLLVEEEGHAASLLGNEAIVRGALEAGIGFASGYPGTPSSEVTDSLARVAGARGVVFEYSVNEKIALEMAFAASLAGTRAICAMKHLGLMYAGDPLSTIPYMGTRGGMVIVSAGDPSCRTSPNEQDQRYLASMLGIPTLDPCTPGEAYHMARAAFRLSEQVRLPVILRPTTRVCHSRGVVTFGPLKAPEVKGFVRDPTRLIPIPVFARPMRLDLEDRLARAAELLDETDFVRASAGEEAAAAVHGIIAAGAPASTCKDLLLEYDLADKVPVLTVGVVHPLPEKKLVEFLQRLERVLIVEELTPYLEDLVLALCSRHRLTVQVLGKHSGHLPVPFEYEPEILRRGLHGALGLGPEPTRRPDAPEVPVRPPVLCSSCPHRTSYFTARAVFGPERLFFNDIGCYTLGFAPPLESGDALLCMGAGITLAAGVARVTGERTVGFLGDSTFFHSGMPALLNAIKEEVGMVVVVLDNQVTAMTGFQESPSVEAQDGQPVRHLSIADAARGLGAAHVEVTDPADLPGTMAALARARDADGVSVVIMEHPCPVYMGRIAPEAPPPPYQIDQERCQTCGRESGGHRCGLEPDRNLMRHMARATAQQTKEEVGCNPGKAPCSTRCPLSHCIQGYVGNIAAGNHAEALELILEKNPLPETVCRVCHRPCEDACVRAGADQPVAINDLKRFLVTWAREQPEDALPAAPTPAEENGLGVAVVGAGPSGLAAAHELRMRGYRVTLLDREQEPGGLLLTGIPEFRLPRAALRRDVERLLSMGIEFRGGVELGEDVTLEGLLHEHDAVYLAVGACRGVPLKLEEPADVAGPARVDALPYLRAANLGLPIKTGNRVAVVGGGNAAIDAARTARRQGAQQVTIVYRRRRQEMPAIDHEIEAAEAEGISVRTQLAPISVQELGLECVETKPGAPDASGRCWPEPVEGSEAVVPADQIILAIGQVPEELALDTGANNQALDLEKDGCLKVDGETCRTAHPRVFAGGDVVWGERTVTWAMGTGQRAAWAMDRELRGEEAAGLRPPPPLPTTPRLGSEQPPIAGFPPAARIQPAELDPLARSSTGDEVVAALTEEEARAEAGRCLSCGMCGNCRSCIDLFGCPAFYMDGGHVAIDPALCNGCGVCAYICPNQAIGPVERK